MIVLHARDYSRGVAQPGRAPGSGPGGRRFKSSLPDQYFQGHKLHFWFSVYSDGVEIVDGHVFLYFPLGFHRELQSDLPPRTRLSPYKWNINTESVGMPSNPSSRLTVDQPSSLNPLMDSCFSRYLVCEMCASPRRNVLGQLGRLPSFNLPQARFSLPISDRRYQTSCYSSKTGPVGPSFSNYANRIATSLLALLSGLWLWAARYFTATSCTPLLLASGWGCRNRRPSKS